MEEKMMMGLEKGRVEEKSTDLLIVFCAELEGADWVGVTEGAPAPDFTAHCRLFGSRVTLVMRKTAGEVGV